MNNNEYFVITFPKLIKLTYRENFLPSYHSITTSFVYIVINLVIFFYRNSRKYEVGVVLKIPYNLLNLSNFTTPGWCYMNGERWEFLCFHCENVAYEIIGCFITKADEIYRERFIRILLCFYRWHFFIVIRK